jgi:hypothetical protein
MDLRGLSGGIHTYITHISSGDELSGPSPTLKLCVVPHRVHAVIVRVDPAEL